MGRYTAVLVLGNVLYGTSYVVTRVALDGVPPATLAFVRLSLGALVLLPLLRRAPGARGDGVRIFWMGALGFAAAFAFAHWGIERSSATNAALLIVVEPLTLVALGPLLLGERLSRREVAGAILSVIGAAVVVLDGVPGWTVRILPRWRGDLLLIVSGLAYASYSLIGRTVLTPGRAASVTARSIVWGAVLMAPLAVGEWASGQRPTASASAIVATLYLALVITAAGYLVWNWVLERIEASRAAPFLTVQPVVGAVLGALALGEPVSRFTLAGAALIVVGLWMTVTRPS